VIRLDPLGWKKDSSTQGLSKAVRFIRIGSGIEKLKPIKFG